MKIRTGFVSNSSSSSFIIIGENTKRSEKKLRDAIINKIGKFFYTEEEFINFIKSEYDYEDEDDINTDFKEELELLRSGKFIFKGIISDELDILPDVKELSDKYTIEWR